MRGCKFRPVSAHSYSGKSSFHSVQKGNPELGGFHGRIGLTDICRDLVTVGAHLSLTRSSWAHSACGKHGLAPGSAIFDGLCDLRKRLIVDGRWRARRHDISTAATSTRDPIYGWSGRKADSCSGAPPHRVCAGDWRGAVNRQPRNPAALGHTERPVSNSGGKQIITVSLRFEGQDHRVGARLSPDSESRGPGGT